MFKLRKAKEDYEKDVHCYREDWNFSVLLAVKGLVSLALWHYTVALHLTPPAVRRCVKYQKQKKAVVLDCIIVLHQWHLAKMTVIIKEQRLSNFLENSGFYRQPLRKFRLFTVLYFPVRSSIRAAILQCQNYLGGGGCLGGIPTPALSVHLKIKMASMTRYISTISRKNRGLWTVYTKFGATCGWG